MYYGTFGPVNFVFAHRELSEREILGYVDYPPEKPKLSQIIENHKKNLWTIHVGMWRMVTCAFMPRNEYRVTDYTPNRRVMPIWLDELFPNIYKPNNVWVKHWDKIKPRIKDEWGKMGVTSRQCVVRLVITHRPDQLISEGTLKILQDLWKMLGYPTEGNYSLSQRFYVFTSSLPGVLGRKSKVLSKFPKAAKKIIALVGDDVSFTDTIRLCKKHDMRASFDSRVARDDEGELVKVDSKEWKYLEATWRSNKGSSPMMPVVFTSSSEKDPKKMNKLLRHYTKKASVVIYKRKKQL